MDQAQPELTLEESIEQVMMTLPAPVREYLAEEKHAPVVASLIATYRLTPEQGKILERETMLLVMGVEGPMDFAESLTEEAKLSEQTIRSISADVNSQIFVPLRKEVEGAQAVTVTPVTPAAPVPQPAPQGVGLELKVQGAIQSLPPVIRDYLVQKKYTPVARQMMLKHKLRIDQAAVLESEIRLLLAGMKTPAEFTQALASDARIDQQTINSIVKEVNDQIFIPLRKIEETRGVNAEPVKPVEATKPAMRQTQAAPAPVPQTRVFIAPAGNQNQGIAPLPPKMIMPQPAKPNRTLGEIVQSILPAPKRVESSSTLEDHEEPHIEFVSKPAVPMAPPAPAAPRFVPPAPADLPGTFPQNIPVAAPAAPAIPVPETAPVAAASAPAPAPRPAPAPAAAPMRAAPTLIKSYAADPYRELVDDEPVDEMGAR